MSVHEARFARQFNASVVRGNRWQVTSELEIRERPVLTEDGLAIALDSDLSALFATIGRLHGLVHATLPGALS